MSFLAPLNLAWLALLPVLLLLYVMKLRRREVRISAAFLWQRAAREARVDSFFHRLKVNVFLLLQLLALLALVLGLSRPYTLAPGQLAGQVVLMLDCSASMQAGQRFPEARARARQLVRQAPGGAEVMLVALGAQARVLVPFTTDRTRVLRELDRLEPQDAEGDLSAVRPLAQSISLSKPHAEIVLLGDSLPSGPLPPNLRFLGFGTEGRNLAVTGFQVFERQGQRQAFIALASYSPQAESVPLQVYQGGKLLFTRPVQVAANSRRSLTLPLPEGNEDVYELRLGLPDDLAVDNRHCALPPRQTTQTVQLVGPVSRFVEKALVAQPRVKVQRVAQPTGSPSLVVWETPPDRLPPGVHLLLHPPRAWRQGELAGVEPLVLADQPLVKGLPIDRCLVGGRVKATSPGLRQEVLATAGSEPALVLLRGDDAQAVMLDFDLDRSDLPLSPAFPMLMSRLLEHLVAGSLDTAAESLVAGQELTVRSAVPVEMVDPAGHRRTLTPRQGRVTSLDTWRAGVYRLRAEGQERRLAINFLSPQESQLTAPPEDTGGTVAGAAADQAPSMLEEYWQELALLALVALLVEWLLYWGGLRRGV